jgi:hypothetical protein
MGTEGSQPERLRSALELVLHAGDPDAPLRDDIWMSWRRSANSGLSPERLVVPRGRR